MKQPFNWSSIFSAQNVRRILNQAWKCIRGPLCAVLIALAIGAGFIALMGYNPLQAYFILFKGAFGSVKGWTETLIKASPLLFTGTAYAFAARCGLYNIGSEGQLTAGALAGVFVGYSLQGLPAAVHIPLCLVTAFLGGALWGAVPGALKAFRGNNEMITSIMLSYVATFFADLMLNGPMSEPPGSLPQTSLVAESAALPILVRGTRLHLGLLVAIVCVTAFHIILMRTAWGFQLRTVGTNPRSARYAGIKAPRIMILTMAISGGIAGVGGACEVTGVLGRMYASFSPGYGFDGIAVAMLGQSTAPGVLLAALLMGGLRNGANAMQISMGVPVEIIKIIQAVIIAAIVVMNVERRGGFRFRALLDKLRKGGKVNA